MRRRVLVSSVQRLLRDDEQLVDVVFMWRHQRWMIVSAALVAAAVYSVTTALSFGADSTRVGLSLAVALLVSVFRTEYRVLALTTAPRWVLFGASRVRQVAVAPLADFGSAVDIEVQSSNLVLTEWLVDGERYSVPKSSQAAMSRLAAQ